MTDVSEQPSKKQQLMQQSRTKPKMSGKATVITELNKSDDNSKYKADEPQDAIPTDDRKSVIPTDDQKDVKPADDQKDAKIADDLKNGIPVDDQEDAITAVERKDKMSTDDRKNLIPADNRKDAIPTDKEENRISADDHKDITTADDRKDIVPVDHREDAMQSHNQKEVIPANDRMDLITAARKNDVNKVTQLLQDNQYPTENVIENGWTALHFAAYAGYKDVVEAIINHKNCSVNAAMHEGHNALHMAAQVGHVGVVTTLLNQPECSINAVTNKGFNALHLAAECGFADVIPILLQHPQCSINAVNNDGFNALHLAIEKGHRDIALSFMHNPKCSIKAVINAGHNALHLAAQYGRTEIATLLLDKFQFSINAVTHKGFTALHLAAEKGHMEVFLKLIRYPKCLINAIANEGHNALHLAAQYGHTKLVSLLLQQHNQCQVKAATNKGYNALHLAAGYGRESTVVALLEHEQLAINEVANEGFNALHLAARNGHKDVVSVLLQLPECDVHSLTKGGETALHLAAQFSQNLDIIKLLIEKKTNINAKMSTGATPLHLAAQLANVDVVKCLIDHQGDVNARMNDDATVLHAAAHYGQADIVAVLIHQQVDVNAKNNEGFTPLHFAAQNAHTKTASILLKHHKIDPTISNDNEGATALSMALAGAPAAESFICSKNIYNMIQALLVKGVDANIPQSNLATAVLHSSIQVVELLFEYAGDPNSTEKGESALHIAVRIGSTAKCDLLLRHGAKTDAVFDEMTPLQYAMVKGTQPEIIQLLLDHTREPVDVASLLSICNVENREVPLLCHAISLGTKSFIEALADSKSLEESDFTGLNAIQLICKYPKLRKWLSHKYPEVFAKHNNSEMVEWYKYKKHINTSIDPHQNDFVQTSSAKLYQEALAFTRHTVEVADIENQVVTLLTAASDDMRKSQSKHLQFKPIVRGSVGEGTKVALPDEFDVVCVLTECTDFTVEEGILSKTHRRIKIDQGSPFLEACSEEGYLLATGLGRMFYASLIASLTKFLPNSFTGQTGRLFLHHHFFDRHDKISCIKVIWRGQNFKDLPFKIDLVPAIYFEGYQLESPLPLGVGADFHLIPKRSGFAGHDIDIPISYSECERNVILNLPKNIKEGYILAKACRDKRACCPDTSLPIAETIQVDDYLTSYRLKTSLMFLLDELGGKEAILQNTQTKEQWAKAIYQKLLQLLKEGYISSYYVPHFKSCVVFLCEHAADIPLDERAGCCHKRHLMQTLATQIISFLDKENAEQA